MAISVKFSNPKTLAPPPGYSYVVESSSKRMRIIHFAGQLGLNMENKLVGPSGDFRSQCVKAFENMTLALDAAGVAWKDVVKINNYLVDIGKNIPIFREVRDKYLNMSAPPASTTVGVPELARPGALFEIEAIAVAPVRGRAAAKSSKEASKKKSSKKKSKRDKR